MKIARTSFLIVLTLAGSALIVYQLFFTNPTVLCADLIPKPRIVAFGDSLVAGSGAPEGSGLVDILSSTTQVPIQNMGVAGNTTEDGLARVQELLDVRPDMVILLLGGNDALRKVPLAQTTANLDSILKTVSDEGINIVLLAPPGGLLRDPYAQVYKTLAKKYSTELVPNVLSGILGRSEFMSDTVHPNSRGYKKMSEKVLPALNRACNTYATTVGGS